MTSSLRANLTYCPRCRREYAPGRSLCPEDGNQLLPVALRREGRDVSLQAPPAPAPQRLSDARNATRKAPWVKGLYEDLLHKYPRGPILLWGEPGARKTTWAIGAIVAARRAGSKVAWIDAEGSPETRHSLTKVAKLERAVMDRIDVYGGVTHVSQVDDILASAQIDVLLIDSITVLNAEPGDLLRWAGQVDSLIAIAQATKSGSFRGSLELSHVVDVVIHGKDGKVHCTKNRYSNGTNDWIEVQAFIDNARPAIEYADPDDHADDGQEQPLPSNVVPLFPRRQE